jgi:hypothetical protein
MDLQKQIVKKVTLRQLSPHQIQSKKIALERFLFMVHRRLQKAQ